MRSILAVSNSYAPVFLESTIIKLLPPAIQKYHSIKAPDDFHVAETNEPFLVLILFATALKCSLFTRCLPLSPLPLPSLLCLSLNTAFFWLPSCYVEDTPRNPLACPHLPSPNTQSLDLLSFLSSLNLLIILSRFLALNIIYMLMTHTFPFLA